MPTNWSEVRHRVARRAASRYLPLPTPKSRRCPSRTRSIPEPWCPDVKLAYFTGGTAGAGHMVRGLAIGRALERAGYRGEMRMFVSVEPFAGLRPALAPLSPTVCPIDPEEVLDPVRGPASKLATALIDYAPDLLIADLFWAPLLHIRPLLDCEAWLIVRSCPPIWLRGAPKTRFDPSQYARVIGIEPVEHEEIREHIEPIVICNPDEAKTRAELCERWGVDERTWIVAISHAGLRGEISTLRADHEANAEGDDDEDETLIIQSDLHDENAIFPLAVWLSAVDQVHCVAGYNSYWESRWMGYAHQTQLRVIGRKIDDPLGRVKAGRSYKMRENGADVLARSIIG